MQQKSKETNHVSMGSSDVVTVESTCPKTKLCREAGPLASLRGQEELFTSPCKKRTVTGNKQDTHALALKGSAWFSLHEIEFSLAN